MWLAGTLKEGLRQAVYRKSQTLIRRWPKDPKVVFFGPPNVFVDELTQR
jgi:hypothetical protein